MKLEWSAPRGLEKKLWGHFIWLLYILLPGGELGAEVVEGGSAAVEYYL